MLRPRGARSDQDDLFDNVMIMTMKKIIIMMAINGNELINEWSPDDELVLRQPASLA